MTTCIHAKVHEEFFFFYTTCRSAISWEIPVLNQCTSDKKMLTFSYISLVSMWWLMVGSWSEFFFIQKDHTAASFSHTHDSQFIELSFEAPRASVINVLIHFTWIHSSILMFALDHVLLNSPLLCICYVFYVYVIIYINSSLQNLVLLYLFLPKVNRKRGYNVTFLEITILNIKLWSY